MHVLRAIPLLVLPALIYALFALPLGAEGMRQLLAAPALAIPMVTDVDWIVTRGHLFIMLAIICLFLEVLKSTTPTTGAMIENTFAVLLFALLLIAFLLWPGFATSEFFLIMMMCALDFMAGAVVMVSTARRTVAYE